MILVTKYFFVITCILIISCDESINDPSDNNDNNDNNLNCPTFSITDIFNGDASLNNFNVSFSSETNIVIGFNLSGTNIQPGCGILSEFSNIYGIAESLNDVVFSDNNGNALNISYINGTYTSGCDLPENKVSIYNNKIIYNSNSPLGGFQFKIVGSDVIICEDGSVVCTLDECPTSNYFNLNIQETGESTLFIFQDTITTLATGDQIGVFDSNGISDNQGTIGEVLVGFGTWNNQQLDIVAIMSQDLSSFNGPILPGALAQNNVVIKIWKNDTQILEENISAIIDTGTGTFNGIFTAYSQLTIQE